MGRHKGSDKQDETKAAIKKIVDGEDKPLTSTQIAALVKAQGIDRHPQYINMLMRAMGIPNWRQRVKAWRDKQNA